MNPLFRLIYSRPDTSYSWFRNPWKAFRFVVCRYYKWRVICCLICVLLLVLFACGIYAFPGYMVKRIVGAWRKRRAAISTVWKTIADKRIRSYSIEEFIDCEHFARPVRPPFNCATTQRSRSVNDQFHQLTASVFIVSLTNRSPCCSPTIAARVSKNRVIQCSVCTVIK